MITIGNETLRTLSDKAKASKRHRKIQNFHFGDADPLQRMLNAMEPGTYVRPHKHESPDKREVFIILKGKVAVIEMNDKGIISEHVILDSTTGPYAVEISPRVWHSLISLEAGSVLYEVKDGPYDPNTDKVFAPWAPEEESPGVEAYFNKMKQALKI